MTPPCRVCKKSGPVLCYPDDHALTICPDCCDLANHPDGTSSHAWRHDPVERDYECLRCGVYRRFTEHAHEPFGSYD